MKRKDNKQVMEQNKCTWKCTHLELNSKNKLCKMKIQVKHDKHCNEKGNTSINHLNFKPITIVLFDFS